MSIAVASGIAGLHFDRALEILEEAIAKDECLVHEDETGVVDALLVVYRQAFFGRDFIKLLAVADRARRKGVGVRLVRRALETARTDTVFISTNQSNVAMRALLHREHWIFSGRLTGIDDDDPELVYRRRRSSTSRAMAP